MTCDMLTVILFRCLYGTDRKHEIYLILRKAYFILKLTFVSRLKTLKIST